MSPLYIARSREIAARALDGEMMIMSARDSTLFNLNELGTIIWQAADGSTTLEDIVAKRICVEFEVEPAEALQDAESFVRELADKGILLLSDQPGSASRRCAHAFEAASTRGDTVDRRLRTRTLPRIQSTTARRVGSRSSPARREFIAARSRSSRCASAARNESCEFM